jgi:hypothetical protein
MTLPAFSSTDVLVAGVPWPRHKLFAVIAGLITLALIGMVTTSAAPAVLGGAAVALVVGLTVRALARPRG